MPDHTPPAPPPEWRAGTYIVIAAFNEGGAVGRVVRDVRTAFPNVVVVDDGSKDNTAIEASEAGAIVLQHLVNRGQGAALQTGISYALLHGAKVVVTFDADGQHRVSNIPAMLAPIIEGRAEIVLGSRFLEHAGAVPRGRRMMLSLALLFTRVTSGLSLTDTHNGFRAFSRCGAQHIDIQLDRMAHASEIIDQVKHSGLPYCEVPVHIEYTDYSLAKGQRGSAAFRVAFEYLVGRLLK
jgi:polyprenyl-phospho-N-acetylgalactosaminyl synthase